MAPDEISSLKEELRTKEQSGARKFTLYTGIMLILGVSIGVWTVWAANNARKYQQQSEASQRKNDSLELRITKANEKLLQLQEKLLRGHEINGYIRAGLDNFYSGRYDMAINDYNEAIKLDPENFVMYDLRGYSQLKLKRYKEAVESLRKSVEINSNYTWGYYNLALACWASGDKGESKKAIQKLLEVDPTFKKRILNDSQFQPIVRDADIGKILN